MSSFLNNFIGSVNGPGFISTQGSRNIVIIDGQRITASHGDKSIVAKKIKVIALDGQGNELESFVLPTGTEICLQVTVEPKTEIKSIETSVASISIHGDAVVRQVESTNGSITIEGAGKVGDVRTTNGNVEVKANTVGNIRTTNGNIKRR